MATYTFNLYITNNSLIGVNNGTVTIADIVTVTVTDEDSLGIGESFAPISGAQETGASPVVTSVSDPAYSSFVGQSFGTDTGWLAGFSTGTQQIYDAWISTPTSPGANTLTFSGSSIDTTSGYLYSYGFFAVPPADSDFAPQIGDTVTLSGWNFDRPPEAIPLAVTTSDGIIEGTTGNDLIDLVYTGDPDGDLVDNSDATNGIGAAGSNDDSILAGDGNDTVKAGDGNDTVSGGAGLDSIEAGVGDDSLDGGDGADNLFGDAGNDLIYGGLDNDTLYGGADNDTLYGGTGNDSLIGGEGDDSLDGSDGDDNLFLGAGDGALGGFGSDIFAIDDTLTGNTPITVIGGEDVGGGDTDVLDLRGLTDVVVTYGGGNNEAGTATYTNGAGETVTVNFSEIESVFSDSAGDGIPDVILDGIVDGTAGGDLIDTAYTGDPDGDMVDNNDALGGASGSLGSNDDSIRAGAGNDTVHAAGGNDTVDAGDGDDSVSGGLGADTLYGGTGNDFLVGGEESQAAAGTGSGALNDVTNGTYPTLTFDGVSVTNNSGPVEVDSTFDFYNPIYSGTNYIDINRSHSGDETLTFTYDQPRVGISFHATAADLANLSDDIIAKVTVTLTDGSIQVLDVIDTTEFTGTGGAFSYTAPTGLGIVSWTLKTEPSPEIGGGDWLHIHDGGEYGLAGAAVADLDLDPSGDLLDGGLGLDTLYGGAGADTLSGGEGDDSLEGGEGDDLLQIGAGDVALGGLGGDIFEVDDTLTGNTPITVIGGEDAGDTDTDVLDLRGLSDVVVTYDGADPEAGTATYTNGTGETVTINFSEIESVLRDIAPDGIVDGTAGGDLIDTAYTGDPDGDMVDNNDALGGASGTLGSNDDSIRAGAGDDTVLAGAGNDTVDASSGNDIIDGGAGNDSILGGDGNDTLAGDEGDDTVTGGAGDDLIVGGTQNPSENQLVDGSFETLMPTAVPGPGLAGNLAEWDSWNATTPDLHQEGVVEPYDFDRISPTDGQHYVGLANSSYGDWREGLFQNLATPIPAGTGINFSIDAAALSNPAGDGLSYPDPGIVNLNVWGRSDNATTNNASSIGVPAGWILLGEVTVSGDQMATYTMTLNPAFDLKSIAVSIGPHDGANDALTIDNVQLTFDEPEGDLNTGNDSLFGDIGSDTIFGADGNDTLDGGADNDTLYGGTGNDILIGGEGDDSLDGGDGDDNLFIGAGDGAIGGFGSDTFVIDDTLTGNTPITVIGGEDVGDTDTDVLDLRGLDDVVVTYDGADPEAGTATYTNGAGETVTINFSEIESVLTGAALDGIVDGTAGNDLIDTAYTGDSDGDMVDANDATNGIGVSGSNDDSIRAGDGNDTVLAGLGDDTVSGDAGDDSLVGGDGSDSLLGGDGSDTLSGGDGADVLDGGAGDDDLFVGGADTATGGSGDDVFTLDATDPAADIAVTIDGGSDATDGNPDDTANGDAGDVLDLGDQTADLTVTLGTDPETGTVDGLDADGTPDITFTEIENLVTGSGDDTVDGGAATSPVVVHTGAGDDSITTGSGDDSISAGFGADTIDAGEGNDTIDLFFDGDADVIVLADGDGNDTLTGFDVPFDFDGDGIITGVDTLDVSGLTDADGNPVNTADVVVTDTNGDGTGDPILTFPNGESITLAGVDPTALLDPATQTDVLVALGIPAVGPVDGTAGDDVMTPTSGPGGTPYTDAQGDQVDGTDGLDDTIFGNGGNDSI
jgi:Ca2+-binding RTX toxin-like protein